jgi:hypothetical protein
MASNRLTAKAKEKAIISNERRSYRSAKYPPKGLSRKEGIMAANVTLPAQARELVSSSERAALATMRAQTPD